MVTPETKSNLGWEAAGVLFISVLGSALHFAFAWSGYWPAVATFAAVNQSIWEHLKLAFWPGFLWAAIERPNLVVGRSDFWAAKGIALLVAPVTIVLIFTTYTGILGRNILYLDIGTFIVAVALGQLVSAWLIGLGPKSPVPRRLGHLLLGLQVLAYSTLTFFPPKVDLFMDHRNGTYGIPAQEDRGARALLVSSVADFFRRTVCCQRLSPVSTYWTVGLI